MSAIGLIKKIFQIELLNPEEFHWGGAGGRAGVSLRSCLPHGNLKQKLSQGFVLLP